MNSKELKNLAIAYKKVSDKLMQAAKELASIEKMISTTTKPKPPKTKTKAKANQNILNTFENELLNEIKKSNELVKKALE